MKVLGASALLFLVWSTAASAQLGDLVSGVVQTLTGEDQVSVGVPGVATINIGGDGGTGGTGVSIGVSVLGGGNNTGLDVRSLGSVNLGLPGGSSPDPGPGVDERPVTENPGWIGQDVIETSTNGLSTVGGQRLLPGNTIINRNGIGPGGNLLGGEREDLALDGNVSSRMRTLLGVMSRREWTALATADGLCLSNFGAARMGGWLRPGDIERLDEVVTQYGSDIEQLRRLIANCRSNREVISRGDIERVIGLDVRDGQTVLFML